jgi:NAD(P)H-hydrate epimerase
MTSPDAAQFPVVDAVPDVDTPQMIEVDRLMMEDYDISLFQMMENAGRCLAILARDRFLDGSAHRRRVAVLAGGGGNGGGAITAGRRLAAWGANVVVALAQPPEDMSAVPRSQLAIARRIEGVDVVDHDIPLGAFDVVLDGLVGYSLAGAPTGRAAALIDWANRSGVSILALDVPSGFDATAGVLREPAIRAAATLTIALPKRGMRTPEVVGHVGELYLADISVPPGLYRRLRPPIELGPIFHASDIVRIA